MIQCFEQFVSCFENSDYLIKQLVWMLILRCWGSVEEHEVREKWESGFCVCASPQHHQTSQQDAANKCECGCVIVRIISRDSGQSRLTTEWLWWNLLGTLTHASCVGTNQKAAKAQTTHCAADALKAAGWCSRGHVLLEDSSFTCWPVSHPSTVFWFLFVSVLTSALDDQIRTGQAPETKLPLTWTWRTVVCPSTHHSVWGRWVL